MPQQPYFKPGVAIGRQHFWSAEPVEWSPIGNLPNNGTPRNDVPFHASTYLQDKAEAKPLESAASVASLDVPAPAPTVMSEQSELPAGQEAESAFGLRLRKLLPIIVVVLLLLGLLGALLSSAFFPSGGPGANSIPLHSISGTMASVFREIALWT